LKISKILYFLFYSFTTSIFTASYYIECGRYRNIEQSNRICTYDLNDIEDKLHFILKCPCYKDLRLKYLKKYYFDNPSVFKLIKLLNSKTITEINNLGKFIILANKIRSENFFVDV